MHRAAARDQVDQHADHRVIKVQNQVTHRKITTIVQKMFKSG